MAHVHISEFELLRDPAAVIARADAGEDVIVDRPQGRPALLLSRRSEGFASQESLEYLSEFRKRHPEPLDSSKWD